MYIACHLAHLPVYVLTRSPNSFIVSKTVDAHFLEMSTVAPMVKVPYWEVIQGEGEWTQLSCHVTTNPAAELYWMRNGRRVENLGSYAVASQEEIDRYRHLMRLSIGTLGHSDFGEYECLAENRYGKDGGQIRLLGKNSILKLQ